MGLYNQSLNENVDNVQISGLIGGEGGGGSHFKSEVLYTNSGTGREDITLSKPYTDFDYLDITVIKFDANSSYDFMHTFIDCSQQLAITNNEFFAGRSNTNIFDVWSSGNSYFRFKFTDETHLTYPSDLEPYSGSNAIYQIKGIKL